MFPTRKIAAFFATAFFCAALHAAPLQITVTVADPEGVPIHGAGVSIGLQYTEPPIAFESTDANGRVIIVIDAPDVPLLRGHVRVSEGGRDGEPFLDSMMRWKTLSQLYQFPVAGEVFEIIFGQPEIEIDIAAVPTIEVRGSLRMADAPVSRDLIGASAAPLASTRSESNQNGFFALRIARESPVIFIDIGCCFYLIAPHIPPDAGDEIDLGVIQLQEPMGLLAGHVLVGEDPAPGGTIYAMRTDGTILSMLFSDGEGRLDGDINAPGPDPDDPDEGTSLPAGEYIFAIWNDNFNVSLLEMALHAAVTQGAAPAELNALPHVVVPEDGRAVVTIDFEQLEAATKALIDAALGP